MIVFPVPECQDNIGFAVEYNWKAPISGEKIFSKNWEVLLYTVDNIWIELMKVLNSE